MSFSDGRTPPPSWAVEFGASSSDTAAAVPDPVTEATVISMRTRRRVTRVPVERESAPHTGDREPDPHDWAREIVLRMLTAAPKTRSELAEGLRRKDCPPDVAAVVLDRLEEVGLVDDAAFAADFVRSQQAARGLSGRVLSQKLRAKGVDPDTTREALELVDPHVEEEQARQLVGRKLRAMHGLDAVVQTRRLAGMLARKGYGPELSMRLIREAIADSDEHRRD